MKMMITMLSVLLLSVSCVELNGTINVNQAFNVKVKSGFLNLKRKTITIAPGQYSAELNAKTKKSVSLVLKGGSLGEINIPIKSDDSLNIPFEGLINIESAKIEQPFNITGVIHTDVEQYGYATEAQSCDIQRIEHRCEKVCVKDPKDNRGEGKCDVVCRDVTVTFPGEKMVSYHYSRTDRQAELQFMAEGSTSIVATLPVHGSETSKITDNESLCR
ncbi:MAG: hypothetical protein H7177_03750 [Rhizobacter sp.]|nr:hypothetical protein [Bacteriovorax sp.]